ncbi:helix-turn-helix transcriptional regulator [Rathayibacter tanaceti]|uniref:DNA-binding transcriptional regulator YafY n=2 Tax=Rathayibacter tanaceti TaxID=1671680 RepID=A0ACD2XKD8_9MICO|nr:WYL domain-containing protein [Rathayibacter tanaceti]QHC54781.1 WYL domain-containing protein [Rathayibacter tanaceti]TCO37397.1 putative DNA-binding transcriptional regulator YafY [Rathayibacter tanaceti]
MPAGPAVITSQRLLALLSLLQSNHEWTAPTLASRLRISERTIRRDIDRLRELGYRIDTTRGPEGGYRLGAGESLPPLLFDDEQALAVAITLQTAAITGAGIEEAAARALQTVTRLMPDRLAQRIAGLRVGALASEPRAPRADVDPEVLLRIGEAVQKREEIRFDYATPASDSGAEGGPPRRTEPHHLLLSNGRWYLIGWSTPEDDWRIFRVDRLTLRTHNGRRFDRHEIPGDDPAEFLAARFKGSEQKNRWPCHGKVVIELPAATLAPFAGDGTLEDLGDGRSTYEAGSWSWVSLAALLGRFGAEIDVIEPPELRDAFAELARRYARTAR